MNGKLLLKFTIIVSATVLISACSSKKTIPAAPKASSSSTQSAAAPAASTTSSTTLPATPPVAPSSTPGSTTTRTRPATSKPDFGVITISRHGPGYDISLQLDTGEDNVSFKMDLPEGEDGASKLGSVAEQLRAMDEGGQPSDSVTNNKPSESMGSSTSGPKPGGTANDNIVVAQQLFYRRDYLGALEATLEAIEQQPDFALAYALKGSLYYKMGRREEARTAWQKALELDPNMPDVKATLDTLY